METTLSQAIADYIEQRKQDKLEPLIKSLNKILEASSDEVTIAKAKLEYEKGAEPIEASFKSDVWLSDASSMAKQISLATHAPKFSNAAAKSSSIKVTQEIYSSEYLTTSSLKDRAYDYVCSAAALGVVGLLNLEVNGDSLIKQLEAGHIQSLHDFTTDKQVLANWHAGFVKALEEQKLSSHNLNKQIYFPLGSKLDAYHLLCPLYSSSMAHKLFQSVNNTRFGESIEVRKARKSEIYNEKFDITYSCVVKQTFGATKNARRNFSRLNIDRDGVGYLLNSAPPAWISQAKSPINYSSILNRQFYFKVSRLIREFKTFLIGLRPDERNFQVRYKRDYQFILPIVDELMNYAASVQAMPGGWSSDADCKLKIQHALWLDLRNPNESFQRERDREDWLPIVSADFASWLNKQLKNDEHYKLGDIEHAWFKKLCMKQLQQFERATPKLGDRV